MVLDELDGECTLAHTSSSHHHQLILRHPCRCSSPHTHTRTRTGRHVAAVEERGDRKRQVSILTDIHTAGLEKMQSTSGDTDKSILILPLLPSGEKT